MSQLAARLADPPQGFQVLEPGDRIIVVYTPQGMGCMKAFLITWIGGWATGTFHLTLAFIRGEMKRPPIPSLLFVLVFLASLIGVGLFAAWMFFGKTMVMLGDDRVAIVRALGRWLRSREVPKGVIRSVRQVQDGGRGDDSFPSWGLRLEADTAVTVLYRQEAERSAWLGLVLAEWAGVEYVPASNG
ncbi:MAG: hypothetical protein KIS66_04435 [Fimbriimonadaceae bacterium]|nr:hypothetical protein [Fimbriimonadaceae bacterium]